jgi:hypothetical protein
MEDVMFIDYCIFRYKQRLEDEIIETSIRIDKATKEDNTDSYKVYAHMLETKQASIIKCDQLSNILQGVKAEGLKNV